MTKIITILLLSIAVNTNAQTLSSIDTNKYRLDLPDYWKAGSKVWRILSDKLPLVCEEIRDKDLCGDDCNPKYRIELFLSDPEIVDFTSSRLSNDRNKETWQHMTYYAFECTLVLFDENQKPLTRFIVVGKDEVWKLVNNTSSYAPAQPVPMKMIVSNNPRQEILVSQPRETPRGGSSPLNQKRIFFPLEKDLFLVVDNKIKSWTKM